MGAGAGGQAVLPRIFVGIVHTYHLDPDKPAQQQYSVLQQLSDIDACKSCRVNILLMH